MMGGAAIKNGEEPAVYKFEVPYKFGSPETQICTDGVLVEIARFDPQEINVDSCLSHHLLVSWIFPQPVLGQCIFGSPGPSSRLCNFGNLSFIPATVPTLTRYRPEGGPRQAVVVRFAPQMFEGLLDDESRHKDPWSMASHDLRDPDIQLTMRQLAREAQAPGFASDILVDSLGTSLLVMLARHFGRRGRSDRGQGGLAPWQMRRITERIAEEAVSESFPSLDELAGLVGISAGHLRRAFKQSAGCTLGDHIRNVRLERAQGLLSGSDLSLKEIAARVGFTSPYGFTVAFQRVTGEAPSAFRQRTRMRYLG